MKYRKEWYQKAVTALETKRIVIIQGLRRIGKTTILKEINDNNKFKKTITYSFNVFGNDDEQFLRELITSLPKEQETLLTFDEFQDFPDWNKFFKTIYDLFPKTKIIATGSVSHNTTNTDNTEGGRYFIINMPTLSFPEYIEIFGKIDHKKNKDINFNDFATFGSYPVQDWNTGDRQTYKQQVSTNIIEKIKDADLLAKSSITKSSNVDSILRYIIENVGNTLSEYSITQGTGIQKATAKKIIEYLKDNHLIYRINNSVHGGAKASKLDSKYYLSDHTFYLFSNDAMFDDLEIGYKSMIFENIIGNEFRRRFTRHENMLYFIIDKKNKIDIDFIVTINNKKHYFEVKDSISVDSLSSNQDFFAENNKINIIYRGVSQRIDNKNFINVVDFLNEEEKWI